tara:strand:+ start:2012 stop:2353 length:342 start_codon:yes stop_codon:yes gene_type:complete
MALAKKDKMNVGLIGAIVVLLILAARLIPNFIEQVSKATNMTPSKTSDVLDGVTTVGIGSIVYFLSNLFVKGFIRSSWMFGGLLLIIEGIGDFVGFSISQLWERKSNGQVQVN